MNLATFDLNLLRVLDALLRERSTVRAGARIGLSQPAVSAALGRLRHATGDALFVRQGARLVPTDFARALEGEVGAILERVESLLSAGRFDPAAAQGTVRIGGGDFFCEFLVPRLAADLAQAAPGLRLRMVDLFPADYAATLERQEVDLALMPALPVPDHVVTEELFRSTYRVVARRGHPRLAHLAPGEVFPLDLLCDLGHAMYSSVGADASLGDAALAAVGRTRRVMLTVPSFWGVARAVAGTDLVAILVAEFAEAMAGPLGLAAYRPPMPIAPTPIVMAWHRKSDASPAQAWLRDRVRRHLAPLAAPSPPPAPVL